jgi:hypothetical protein
MILQQQLLTLNVVVAAIWCNGQTAYCVPNFYPSQTVLSQFTPSSFLASAFTNETVETTWNIYCCPQVVL